MDLKDYLIMFVVISLVAFTFGLGYSDLQKTYEFETENRTIGQIQNLNVLNETYGLTEQLEGNLTEGGIVEGASLTGFLKSGYQVLRLLKNSFSFVSGMAYSVVTILGLPSAFYYAVITAVTIFVVFGIINYMFNRTS